MCHWYWYHHQQHFEAIHYQNYYCLPILWRSLSPLEDSQVQCVGHHWVDCSNLLGRRNCLIAEKVRRSVGLDFEVQGRIVHHSEPSGKPQALACGIEVRYSEADRPVQRQERVAGPGAQLVEPREGLQDDWETAGLQVLLQLEQLVDVQQQAGRHAQVVE